ncbi:MAG TPA: DISARM system SNF2-like helicase DrmD [Phycisphaerales bacterium]
MSAGIPEEGQIAHLRERRFVVTGVMADSLRQSNLESTPHHLVRLSSVEDDGLGDQLEVVWELEPGARVLERSTLPSASGLDAPRRLEALLDAVRWAAGSTADHRNVQSPFRSGVEIEDYQLDPVVRAIDMPRANLLVADDVGLGKTIEAGLIILELVLRHRANRVLIVCPAGLQLKWQDEMREKFGLDFRIVDAELMKRLRRTRGIHANPWTHFPRLITSIDYLKRDRPLQAFRETLPALGEPAYPRRYDVLVLDEAQNCAPSGRGKYATDSQRTLTIRELAPHFEHRLFLSATPHNGYQESFTALLELLDDQRFARGRPPEESQLRRVMIRRLKDDITNPDGSRRFPQRRLMPLEVPYSAQEREAHRLLRRYGELRSRSCSSAAERFATEFVLKTLKKRLFSSPLAFLNTLEKHASTVARRRRDAERGSLAALQRQIARADEEFASEDEQDEATDDALSMASSSTPAATDEERKVLTKLTEWAKNESVRVDSKCRVLLDWIRSKLKPGGAWNDERVLIFTEYRDTQKWLVERLAAEGLADAGRLETIYGGMNEDERERIKAHFQHDPKETPVRILVATDCASEGIDLQRYCNLLVHIEIPWNPNRLEQRNGRIDRRGQKREPLIHHFVGKGYAERVKNRQGDSASELEGDLEFLMRAAEKVETIRQDLGKVGTVIADQVEEAMLGKRRTLETETAEQDAARSRQQLKFERNVADRVKRLRERLTDTRSELRLDPRNVKYAVDTALELADLPPLIPVDLVGRPTGSAFRVPDLRGSWNRCTDGLTDTVTQRVRPITFDHQIMDGRTDVVLAHLNHPLVQMSLRLLRAEIWSTEDRKKLHRITARPVPAAKLKDPAIVVHGRLLFVGASHQRLHEELITAAGTTASGRWERLSQTALEELLSVAGHELPHKALHDHLLQLVKSAQDRLLTALEARMNDRVPSITRELEQRRDRDLTDIESVMTELAESIRAGIEGEDDGQMYLEGMTPDEKDQLDRNRDALRRRLASIPEDLKREQEAIRQRFVDPTPRLFPLAVTVLVPEGWARG